MSQILNPYESPRPVVAVAEALLTPVAAPRDAVPYAGAVSVEEALEADRILVPGQRWRFWGIVSVFGILASGAAALAVLKWSRGDDGVLGFGVIAFMLAMLLGLTVFPRLMLLRKARALHRQGYGVYCQTIGYIAPTELHSRTDWASTVILWSAFKGYKFSAHVVLLFWRNDPGFLVLTRGKFASDDQWRQAIEIIAGRVPRL